jgi:putative transposase
MPDHIHIFHIHNPKQSISDLVRNLKIASNQWINSRPDVHQEFKWQIGYGVFSHSHAQKETVINYVLNQEEHHQKGSFKKEYTSILRRNGIDYDPQYLFDFFEGED